jgi:predicted esterase
MIGDPSGRHGTGKPYCTVLSPSSSLWEEQCLLLIPSPDVPSAALRVCFLPFVDEGWTLIGAPPCETAAEVLGLLDDCRRSRGLDLGHLVIVGASEGARLALEVANEMAVPWMGVIPTLPRDLDPGAFTRTSASARGALLLGAEDPGAPRTRSAARMLESAGATVRVTEMPGVGHALPPDVAVHARAALEWIAAGGSAEE